MWEDMTYENILDDMLSRVTSDVDKREGSVIYDALAPCAYQLAQNYFLLNNFLDLVNGDTAVGEYLDRVVSDYGLIRKPPSHAVREIKSSGPVSIGTRWGLNIDNNVEVYNDKGELFRTRNLPYKIVGSKGVNIYSAICEYAGVAGHIYTGQLENIDNVSGITASMEGVISNGYDSETDENLRTRLYTHLQKPSTSGNIHNYREWVLSVPGVGGAKVFPLWDGAGTVKVVIADNNKMPVTEHLIEEVASYIETVRPIGAEVTVTSCTSKNINLTATIILATGYNLQVVLEAFLSAVEEYFKSIAFSLPYVSIARVGTLLLNTEGVIDYNELLLNGTNSNIVLEEEEIPVLGTVGLEV